MVRIEPDIDYISLPPQVFADLPWVATPLVYSKGLSDAAGWFVTHSHYLALPNLH